MRKILEPYLTTDMLRRDLNYYAKVCRIMDRSAAD